MVRWSLVGGADVSEEHNASVFWCHKPDVLHPFPHVETKGNKTRELTRQETCRPTVRCSALNFQAFLSDFAHSTVLDIHLGMTNFVARPFFSEAFSTTLIQTSLFMYKSYYTANLVLCSVGITTRYELDGPGIESRWGDIFSTHPDWPWGLPSLLHNGYRVIPGSKAAGAWRWPPTTI